MLQDFIKKYNLEDKIEYIIDNKEKIAKIASFAVGFLLIALSIFFSYKAYNTYNVLQSKTKTLEVVSDNNVLSMIRAKSLRDVDTLAMALSKNNSELEDNRFYVGKTILSYMYNMNNGAKQKYAPIIESSMLYKLTDQQKKKLRGRSLDIIMQIDDEKYKDTQLRSNFDDLIHSSLVKQFISQYPNISSKGVDSKLANDSRFTKLQDVLKTPYVYELVYIQTYLDNENKKLKDIYDEYKYPYEYFLSNILLPSLNIWKNKYSNKIKTDIFGGEYLKKAGYIDINLISYWSEFFKYAYRARNYKGGSNEVENISIGKLEPIDKKYLKLGLNMSFGVRSDRSFYGLISKLTSTSNIKNVMLISEFTYDLWKNVKKLLNDRLSKIRLDEKLPLGYKYMIVMVQNSIENSKTYNKLFMCKKVDSRGNKTKCWKQLESLTSENGIVSKFDIDRLKSGKFRLSWLPTNSTFYKYIKNSYYNINDIDKLIGARLDDCVRDDGYCDDILSNNRRGDIVFKTIGDFGQCEYRELNGCLEKGGSSSLCKVCKNKFINKFDTNYFIAYTLSTSLGKQTSVLISKLKDTYNNIPGLLKLGQFSFSKVENLSYKYNAKINLDVYYKYISDDDIKEILAYIGKNKCKSVTQNKNWSIDIAKKFIDKKLKNLYKQNIGADEIYQINTLSNLIEKIKTDIKSANNIDKLLYNLQVYRIFKEHNYCN